MKYYAIADTKVITVPAKPQLKGATTTFDANQAGQRSADLTGQGGSVGVLFNGAMLYSPFAGGANTLSGHTTSATYLEGNTFDQCGCHSSSTTAASYHCHVPPNCLMYQLGGNAISTTAHSPQVGWAADG